MTRNKAAVVGIMTIGRTQERGVKVGRVRAGKGRPESIESQVEQTLARGWALRLEWGLAMEVVKDRIGNATARGEVAKEGGNEQDGATGEDDVVNEGKHGVERRRDVGIRRDGE